MKVKQTPLRVKIRARKGSSQGGCVDWGLVITIPLVQVSLSSVIILVAKVTKTKYMEQGAGVIHRGF
jgi:hypothetical protein